MGKVMRHRSAVCVLLTIVTLLCRDTAAQPDDAIVSPTQSAEESAARQAEADFSFTNILAPQQAVNQGVVIQEKMPAPSRRRPVMPFPEAEAPPPPPADSAGTTTAERSAELPLADYAALRRRLNEQRERRALVEGPNVVLGASRFSGRAVQDALSLQLELQVTLGNNDQWKIVPVIGDDVVLLRATANNETIPVSRQDGYIVWPTRRSGELTVRVEFMVPSRGGRGSLEYDFFIAKTPVTRFSCRFPVAGLEPRIAAAQEARVTSDEESSLLEATLRPTPRIHLVGYKDIGGEDEEEARVFAESMNLLSIEESALEVFSVIRYTILYAGAKQFEVRIPDGMTVISADGEGAFRYVVEPVGDAMVLRGETAFPIRNNYEISIRLRRKTGVDGMAFSAPLPRPLDVEREHGWLAVEVPGKLRIEEMAKQDIIALDVRQLPPEMVKSAVSPIIRAYRYHTPTARVELAYEKLPEKEPASASVDRVRAFSVISEDGRMLTDLKIRLRNRLRPSLALDMPDDVSVLSVHLDGEAVRPSRDAKGRLILPLKRSEGVDSLEQITLQTVLESRVEPFRMAGRETLRLPAIDLPVSSAEWSVYLPARNVYSGLRGDVAKQRYVSDAKWFSSPFSNAPVRVFESPGGADRADGAAATGAGVVAVRIELPRSGTRLDFPRYWIRKGHPVEVSFRYVRSWLTIPAAMLLTLLLAVGLALVNTLWSGRRSRLLPVLGLVLAGAALVPLGGYFGSAAVTFGVLLGTAVTAWRSGLFRHLADVRADWSGNLGRRFKERERESGKTRGFRIVAGVGIVFFGSILIVVLADFISLLFHPL